MTEDEVVALARAVALKTAKDWGREDGIDQYLYGAWLGISAAVAKGETGKALLWLAGKREIMDVLENEEHYQDRYSKHRAPPRVGLETVSPEAPDARPTLLETWGEWSESRRGVPLLHRVVAYLYCVEGWLMRDVGGYWGLSRTRISAILSSFKEAVRAARHRPKEAFRETGRGGEGGSPEAQGCGTGASIQLTAEAEGHSPMRIAHRIGTDASYGLADGGGDQEVAGSGTAGEGGVGGDPEGVEPRRVVGPLPADPETPRRPSRRSVERVAEELPPPERASAKAAALRASMFDGIGSTDVAELMQAMLAKAKSGDTKAAALVLSLIGRG